MTKIKTVTLTQTHPQGLPVCLPGRGHVAPGDAIEVPADEAEALIADGFFSASEPKKATPKKNTQKEN